MSRFVSALCGGVLAILAVLPGNVAAAPSSGSSREPIRIMHFVLTGTVSLERAREYVNQAQAAGFTAVQVLLTDGVRLDHAPWKPVKTAWTKAEFLSWATYVRAHGLDVIPEIKLLTHQEQFFQTHHPGLMFNAVSYDPRKEGVYQVVFRLLDELIDALHPRAIHIGHDEAFGWTVGQVAKRLRFGEVMVPADLFAGDVERIHGYLTQRGVETWMWADMLLDPAEFPGVSSKQLHGMAAGYGKALRNRLPRDIVMCDWHYGDEQVSFPSMAVMQSEGFRVIGATWKREETMRNFSRYALSRHAYGLMATTWFHVQRNDRDLVNWIIRSSGMLFRDPDAAVPPRPVSAASPEGHGWTAP